MSSLYSRSIRGAVEILRLTTSLVVEPSSCGAFMSTRRYASKRTKRGLFGGKRVLSGNNVSEDGGNRYDDYDYHHSRVCLSVCLLYTLLYIHIPTYVYNAFMYVCITRRVWKPNAQNASLYSDILDRKVRFKVTPSALRTIDKAGGLDNYLLYSKDTDLDSERGSRVKMELLNALRLGRLHEEC